MNFDAKDNMRKIRHKNGFGKSLEINIAGLDISFLFFFFLESKYRKMWNWDNKWIDRTKGVLK